MALKVSRALEAARQLQIMWDNFQQLVQLGFLDGTELTRDSGISSGNQNVELYHGLGYAPRGFVLTASHRVEVHFSYQHTATTIRFNITGSSSSEPRYFRVRVF